MQCLRYESNMIHPTIGLITASVKMLKMVDS